MSHEIAVSAHSNTNTEYQLMSIYQPYTYLIGWSNHNKWYYGVRYAQNCNPQDLWKTYFTSSKHVKKFREEYGEPDVIQVRKFFDSKEAAVLWEEKVLRKMNVRDDEKWINKNDCSAPPVMKGKDHPLYNVGHSENAKRKISEKNKGKLKGRKKSKEHRSKISEGLKNQSEDLRKKRSERSLGSCNSNSKLTEIEVIAILEKYDEKESLPGVGKISRNNRVVSYSHIFSMIYAEKYNVNITTIKKIISKQTWKHIRKEGNESPL